MAKAFTGLFAAMIFATAALSADKPPGKAAETNLTFALPPVAPDATVEQGYHDLLALDDSAQEQMDRWIREADAQGDAADAVELGRKIREKIAEVETAYRAFLEKNPSHVESRVAFGSFLNDTGQEMEAKEQWESALKINPKDPAIYNNLAGIYGHRGPVTNAFVYYEKAIELNPNEPVYYHNLGTTVFLFRHDVREHYGIDDEQKIFDKALALYGQAMRLDPTNFILASDIAQTYYGIKPPRHDDALAAWNRAYPLAGDDLERQGVHLHIARIQSQAGRFQEARSNLNLVLDPNYATVKGSVLKMLNQREAGTNSTPRPAAASSSSLSIPTTTLPTTPVPAPPPPPTPARP